MEQNTEVIDNIFIHNKLEALVKYCKQYKIYAVA